MLILVNGGEQLRFKTNKDIDYSIRACGYVRKSRRTDRRVRMIADPESREQETNEDLKRQESLLMRLAESEGVKLLHIYREVVSGETLAERPQAMEMLQAVWAGKWDAIFTVEVERLGRGNQGDQGRIVSTLRHSTQNGNGGTRVVTLTKTYYPDSEDDMAYIEFGLFMSARELATIKKRLNFGIMTSVMDGEYIATFAPYGYKKAVVFGAKTLLKNSNAPVVLLIYRLAAAGVSCPKIATYLNYMLIPTSYGEKWSSVTIRKIIQNRVYEGYIVYGRTKTFAEVDDKLNISKKRKYTHDEQIFEGIHEGIVSTELAQKARRQIKTNSPKPDQYKSVNPFSGVVHCKYCKSAMGVQWNYRKHEYRFVHRGQRGTCLAPSITFERFYKLAVKLLKQKQREIDSILNKDSFIQAKIYRNRKLRELEENLQKCDKSLMNAFDLFDREIISEDEFIKRRSQIIERKSVFARNYQITEDEDTEEVLKNQSYYLAKAIAAIDAGESIKVQNKLIKNVVKDIIYTSDDPPRTKIAEFNLEIILKNSW